MLMNFMGSIGCIMKGSGIEDLFAEVYATNCVEHMFSGKSYARALRAHLMTESALMKLLLEMLRENCDFGIFDEYYRKVLDGSFDENCVRELTSSEEFSKITESFSILEENLKANSRTARLWLLYIYYINIVKLFIFAERTSNWELHLHVVSQMLNLFAATGHNNYAKYARLYLQDMKDLPVNYPWLHEQFLNGHHTVSRSDCHWTSVWTDLIIEIEQTLMCALKSLGGLIHGRGFTETVRHLWILSLSFSATVENSLVELVKLPYRSECESHKERGCSRRFQDFSDCNKFYSWLSTRNPFLIESSNLYSLSTGVCSKDSTDGVNPERAEEIGKQIQQSFDNRCLSDCKIKRKEIVRSLTHLNESRIENKIEKYKVDHQTLFVRLIAIANRVDSLEEVFKYELTAHPLTLFNEDAMMR